MAGASLSRRLLLMLLGLLCAGVMWVERRDSARAQSNPHRPPGPVSFQTGDECVVCHNGLSTPSGEDVSIGVSWRASMMAHSSRDPYWQGAVRREAMDHPEHAAAIEDECAICHMPMTTYPARAAGRLGKIFAHLAGGRDADPLAAEGVSCTVCHQITEERLGSPESFTGGYVLNVARPDSHPMFGPFQIDEGRTRIMQSATGLTPTESRHIQRSELCATCHTLFTDALDAKGRPVGRLPEQVPFLEWQHSAYRGERSCQDCHMPAVSEPTPIASVLGEPRDGLSRHTFLGGNAFMLRMLNRYRNELAVTAPSHDIEAAAAATERQLRADTVTLRIADARRTGTSATFSVIVENLTGHKLPTGYPSRRAWLHVIARDAAGHLLFESGAVAPTGAIAGNANDEDATRYEPHYEAIRSADQVQIYESVMIDLAGMPTTGLLRGVRYAKDNRLLPRGFDKATASADIAVRGAAVEDADFQSGGDRVRYEVDVAQAQGPITVDVELRFQTIAYRWARNLGTYDAAETKRFASYYDAMAQASSLPIAHATARLEPVSPDRGAGTAASRSSISAAARDDSSSSPSGRWRGTR
jgi:hypothetical protein